jgi:hypothetical protein
MESPQALPSFTAHGLRLDRHRTCICICICIRIRERRIPPLANPPYVLAPR